MHTVVANIKNPNILNGTECDILDHDLFKECFQQAKDIVIDPDTPVNVKILIKNMTQCMAAMNQKVKSLETDINESAQDAFRKRLTDIYSNTSNVITLTVNAIVEKTQEYLKAKHSDLYCKSDEDLIARGRLKDLIETYLYDTNQSVEGLTQQELITCVKNRITGLDIIDDAVYRREDIDEIQIDDYNDIYYVIGGERVDSGLAMASPKDMDYLVNCILREAKRVGKPENLSETEPFLRTRLGENCRVSIVRSPIAIRSEGVANFGDPYYQIVIRKQKADKLTLEKLQELGSIDSYTGYLLTLGVRCGISMLFYGGTGTGKSAGMGAVLTALPHDLRTISMAEIEELGLRLIDRRKYIMVDGKQILNKHYKRPFNSVLQWEFQTLTRQMIKGMPGFQGGINAALTMTPDCIIVQETKGAEVKDLSNASLSGHQSFTSLHAPTVPTLKMRYLLMYQDSGVNVRDELILQQLPLAFQWLVGFTRFQGGFRAITRVTELIGYNTQTNELIENVLVQYIPHSTTRKIVVQEDGTEKETYVIKGYHYAVNMPSSASMEIMKNRGFLDSDLIEFKSKFNAPTTRHRSATQIREYYDGLLK